MDASHSMELSIVRGHLGQAERVLVENLGEFITSASYSGSVFRENKRSIANFESASLMILDYDNKPGERATMTLAQAREAFKPYRHIIAPTKSHGKDGADRFRVVLFLSSPITDT